MVSFNFLSTNWSNLHSVSQNLLQIISQSQTPNNQDRCWRPKKSVRAKTPPTDSSSAWVNESPLGEMMAWKPGTFHCFMHTHTDYMNHPGLEQTCTKLSLAQPNPFVGTNQLHTLRHLQIGSDKNKGKFSILEWFLRPELRLAGRTAYPGIRKCNCKYRQTPNVACRVHWSAVGAPLFWSLQDKLIPGNHSQRVHNANAVQISQCVCMCVYLCGETPGHLQLSNKSMWSEHTHMQRGDIHMVGKTKNTWHLKSCWCFGTRSVKSDKMLIRTQTSFSFSTTYQDMQYIYILLLLLTEF